MFSLVASALMNFGPDLLQTAGEKLGLSKRHSEIAKKVADVVLKGEGDIEKVKDGLEELKPEDQLALQSLVNDIEEKRMKHEEKMEEIASGDRASGRDLWKHDTSQEDLYTKRARPTGLYLCYLILIVALVIVPCVTAWKTGVATALELPTEFWYTFTAAFLGYGALRTVDKKGGNLPGPLNSMAGMLGLGDKK